MIYSYSGNYLYNKESVNTYAPLQQGVYYCGSLNSDGSLGTSYVGRAKGTGVTIRSRLQFHLDNDSWADVTHFGYRICTTDKEAEDLEKQETIRLNPRRNKKIG